MKTRFRYTMRMGSTDLKTQMTERKIISIFIHPLYQPNQFAFDVGIVEADVYMEFSANVQQVCLPYLPVDDVDYMENAPVTIADYSNIQTGNINEAYLSMKSSKSQVVDSNTYYHNSSQINIYIYIYIYQCIFNLRLTAWSYASKESHKTLN